MKLVDLKLNGKKKFYWLAAILCLIYGGIALILLIQQSYFIYVRNQFPPGTFARNITQVVNINSRPNIRTIMALPIAVNFFGGLISILAGLSLISILRYKESRELKKEVIDSMVMPDEKNVINELERNNGASTQSELVSNTGLSKVKVHRIVKRLESLGIVKKYPYGVTNKIKLEKILDEE